MLSTEISFQWIDRYGLGVIIVDRLGEGDFFSLLTCWVFVVGTGKNVNGVNFGENVLMLKCGELIILARNMQ